MSPKKNIVKKPLKPKKALPKLKEKQPAAPPSPEPIVPKAAEVFQPPRGMRDILPADEGFWSFILRSAEAISRSFGYGRIETPILEAKGLFVRAVGGQTDIVGKEMYSFVDQGADELALRPEATASVVRAYVSHGMLNLPQPVKLWYLGPFFRREKPQAGRFRQFHQWGLEILGDAHPVLDAEVIMVASTFFREIGIPVTVQINSIGCSICRATYRQELVNFYQGKRELLCAACKERLERNPLRLLDCKEPQCEMLREGAPIMVDFLCDACREHFMKVLEYLDDTAVSYTLNHYLVRGLDYYTRTVFEIWPQPKVDKEEAEDANKESGDKEAEARQEGDADHQGSDPSQVQSAQSALGGGGRYDGLVELLGGRATPAVGCSLGIERIIAKMKELKIAPPTSALPKVFIAELGEAARRKALLLWTELRREVPSVTSLSKDGLKAQLEVANRVGARFAIIIGQKEVVDGTAIIRDMEAGIQEVIDYNKVIADIKKKLGSGG